MSIHITLDTATRVLHPNMITETINTYSTNILQYSTKIIKIHFEDKHSQFNVVALHIKIHFLENTHNSMWWHYI